MQTTIYHHIAAFIFLLVKTNGHDAYYKDGDSLLSVLPSHPFVVQHFGMYTFSMYLLSGSIFGIFISLVFFTRRSRKSLLKSAKERLPLCVLNVILTCFWSAFIWYFKDNYVLFSNDSWNAPENDTLFMFIVHILLLDIFVYCGHYMLHKTGTLQRYHFLYHHQIKCPFAFDFWYLHPMDLFLEFLMPYFLATILSNMSHELIAQFLFFELLANVLGHQTELNFDHIKHHQTASDVSFGIGVFVDPLLGSTSYSLDMQMNQILILPLIYYMVKLQFPPFLYIIVSLLFLSLCFTFLSRYATHLQLFGIKEKIWVLFYNYVSNKLNPFEINLMNWGYYNNEANANYLGGDKESFKKMLYAEMLYFASNERRDKEHISDAKVLEIGCGRGGGIKYLLDTNKIRNVVGVDISIENIKNCRRILTEYLNDLNVKIMIGNAMDLSMLKQNHFDIVINVESSHCYADFDLFCDQVHNVLKQNGTFTFCDWRYTNEWSGIQNKFENSPKWKVIKTADITANIVKASDVMSDYYYKLIAEASPFFLRNIFEGFVNGKGSYVRHEFENKILTYRALSVQKM